MLRSAQMEQIDQLNTILLQDIDHNFARFHQVVTTKLLPEIKRFALASEPTREASKVRMRGSNDLYLDADRVFAFSTVLEILL